MSLCWQEDVDEMKLDGCEAERKKDTEREERERRQKIV